MIYDIGRREELSVVNAAERLRLDMEVFIYITFALVTFAVILLIVDFENIGTFERIWLAFGFAGFWPIVWMLFIPVAIIEGLTSLLKIVRA